MAALVREAAPGYGLPESEAVTVRARGPRPGHRPPRRLEYDLGQARPAVTRGAGARAAPPVPRRAHARASAAPGRARGAGGDAPRALRRPRLPARPDGRGAAGVGEAARRGGLLPGTPRAAAAPSARSPAESEAELRREVPAGRLDGDAVDAVLAAAGHRVGRRRQWPAGLTPREVEVLRLLARGSSSKQIARELVTLPRPRATTSSTSTRRPGHGPELGRASSR